jgi:hypothetical protein
MPDQAGDVGNRPDALALQPADEVRELAYGHARAFVPTKQMRRFLETFMDPSGPRTRSAMARLAHVNRRTVYDWFANPDFAAWWHSEVEQRFRYEMGRVWRRCFELAEQGSAEHIRLVALRFGGLHRGDEGFDSDPKRPQTVVLVNVPSPREQPIIDCRVRAIESPSDKDARST